MDRQVSFLALCHLFEHISRIGKKELKKQKLQLYIDVLWFILLIEIEFVGMAIARPSIVSADQTDATKCTWITQYMSLYVFVA